MKTSLAALTLVGSLAVASVATAGPIPYAAIGTENLTTYTFTAASTGNVTAYFHGSGAAYTNTLSMLVNGIDTGISGLNNHTSAYGTSLVLGSVNAGDVLVFRLNNISPGGIGPWYSDKSFNYDGVNHVYSTDFVGDSIIPVGTYVAFEDLPYGGDFNYNDINFVFTNVRTATGVPEPATVLLFALGLGGLFLVRRRMIQA